MTQDLFPHNQKAYEAVMRSFKTHRHAAVVHATGTGKSYIIAAVTENYNHVLVIAPNDFVLHETQKVCKAGTDFRTYSYVMLNAGTMPRDYDMIVCDEFHRTGASEWGESLKLLIDNNPQAKVLGTSANDVRYMDGMRNMADEMFEGNVVSRITLGDAITRKLLPNPTYVCSVYSIDNDVKELHRLITKSKSDDKEGDLRRLEQISDNWQNSNGMAQIISKYVPNNTRRILAFCNNIESVRNFEELLSGWFHQAGLNRLMFYQITSDDRRAKERLHQFCIDDFDGIKIAISVNMLNEGCHIPGVDGIIMLRSTMSRIIAEQQVGRCLTTTNSNKRPFVLDCVNNIYYFDKNTEQNTERAEPTHESKKHRTASVHQYAFDIIDESRDIRDFLIGMTRKYTKNSWTREILEEDAKQYSTPTQWKNGNPLAYAAAKRKPYYREITSHMKRITYWTREMLEADAKQYSRPTDWLHNSPNAYCAAIKKPYYDELISHMTRKRNYTREILEAEAKKYNTPMEWRNADNAAYSTAVIKPYYLEITSHMARPKIWTREELQAEALKYSSPGEWRSTDPRTSRVARSKSYYYEITAHMKRRKKHPKQL